MKILNIFAKNKEKKKQGNFSDFFLNASEKNKIRVFTDAAKQANKDQRNLVDKVDKIQRRTT